MKHISKVKKEENGKKKTPPKVVVVKKLDDGLDQEFSLKGGKTTTIRKFLSPADVWTTTGRVKRVIISHDGVKKIADAAGISKAPEYTILTQPDAMNNYQYTIQARVCMLKSKDDCAVEIGEANRSNLGSRGRGNPANMAEKRAYDRAVFRLLGITGLLSEEELQDDEEQENKMDGLSPEESKKIAPIVNQLLLARTKADFITFSRGMKEQAKNLNEAQLDYLRKLYKKLLTNVQTSF